MRTHKPTPEELDRLEAARLGASHTGAAVAEARANLAQAIAEDADAQTTLNRAINVVLYGPQDDDEALPGITPTTARELSSPLAQQHWPSAPPAPGG
jgi:hypothetical protein